MIDWVSERVIYDKVLNGFDVPTVDKPHAEMTSQKFRFFTQVLSRTKDFVKIRLFTVRTPSAKPSAIPQSFHEPFTGINIKKGEIRIDSMVTSGFMLGGFPAFAKIATNNRATEFTYTPQGKIKKIF